ncbi:DUF6412 domain-containing protein [Actinomadura viridis]|uniref:DUF6412 domain-containing protein n=1 Tax=Actinomadura viridis TaxID=58110 RepID=UPI003691318F
MLGIAAMLRLLGMGEWIASQAGSGLGIGQPVLLTLAAFTLAGLLALAVVRMRASGRERRSALARVRTTLRERTLRTAFLPQRDPDAAGRPRPRAPGRGLAAA